MTFRVQRLEPRLLWALAAFSVWGTVIQFAAEPAAWALTVLFAAIAGWARTSPATAPAPMGWRALLLLAGVSLFQANAAAGGPDGPAFAWTLAVLVVYALLLPGTWFRVLCVAAVLQFAVVRILAPWDGNWQVQLVQAALCALLMHLCASQARTARQLDAMAEGLRRDRNSHLYNESGFFAHGSELFDECRRRKRPFTLVLLDSHDLRDVSQLAGKRTANQLFADLVRAIADATPPGGIAARTDAVEFGMALPGVPAARAASLLRDALGEPAQVKVVVKDTHLSVILDTAIASATPDVPTLEDMYDRLRSKLLARRATPSATAPSELHSTLQGMLEPDVVMPRYDRPTMPMSLSQVRDTPPRK